MQTVRKLAVKLVKSIIAITPNTWVEYVKRHPKLVAAYSRNLHKSGLLYQLQTIEELTRSYDAFQAYQRTYIDSLLSVAAKQDANASNLSKTSTLPALNLLVCISKYDPELIQHTLDSIAEQSHAFSAIIFLCHEEHEKSLNALLASQLDSPFIVVSETTAIDLTVLEQACFVMYAGDKLAKNIRLLIPEVVDVNTQVAYVDTDSYNSLGEVCFPDFKPDWNPDLQLTTGYIHSGVWVDSLSRLFKVWSEVFSGKSHAISNFDVSAFLCYSYLYFADKNIQHIPLVLLSRPGDTPCFTQAAALVTDLYQPFADLLPSTNPALRLRWHADDSSLVSIIIPTRNGLALVKACIESILNKTTYVNYEILLINNSSDDAECLQYFAELDLHPKIRVINYDKVFNYSAINNFAAKHAKGDILALVNNDIEVISADWLRDMVCQVLRPDIGCVGAKLLFSDDRIQHAGVVMGYGGGAGHAHKYFPAEHNGYMNRLVASHNYSAVTAACLLVTTNDFWAVGGLNEEKLSVAFNDVDLCLKVQQLGRRNLYCAEAILYHHESVSRGHEDTPEKVLRFNAELNYLQTTWCDAIAHDPAYNPNLTRRRENFAIKPFR
ncbi:glycosyltransferase family 2 protein [Pseudoalteromonas sp. NCIMB_1079]|uniref:glycosyltransferase family 2 protein n=1 Tax=Pseudoalteromonas sp. NCIMB 1079 TaxID=3142847 RepID=UPI00339BE894